MRRNELALAVALLVVSSVSAQVPLGTSPFWQSTEVNMYSTGLMWHDANQDGYIDLFVSNGNDIVLASNVIYVSEYGELPQTGSWYSADAEYSGHCAVGDINQDGFPEFVVSNYIGQSGFDEASLVEMYLNTTGLPNTQATWASADSFYTFSCALGDVDNDGDLDLAVATGEGYGNILTPEKLYLNVNGSLQTTPAWESSINTASMDVAWGDIDNDGDLDLATCDDVNGAFIYLNNNGVLTSSPSWQCANPASANTLVFGYVNSDDWLDLVVAFNDQLGGHGQFCAYLNNGSGTINTSPSWQSSTGGYGAAVELYDYDNDGDNDLAAGRWFDRLRVYENLGSGFTSTPVWQASPSTVAEEVAWIDIDGDGLECFVDTISASGSKSLFYLQRQPIQFLDSVVKDGTRLGPADYCFDLRAGWVSLATAPVTGMEVYYQYSTKCDLTISHWDTYNMAYANTNDPNLEFDVDVAVGQAPLSVNFSDNSSGSSNQLWNFGDGNTGSGLSVGHTYQGGGAYDVALQADLSDGAHTRKIRKMVVALADTIYFPDTVLGAVSSFVIPVRLKNDHPIRELTLPLVYAGDVNLSYTGFDTVGCRSSSLYSVALTGEAPSQKRLRFKFVASGGAGDYRPPLPAGDGPIINLHFTRLSGDGTTAIDTMIFSFDSLLTDAGYVAYQPAVYSGTMSFGVDCGDMDGDGSVATISDLVHLVDYFFNGGSAPVSLAAADVDGELGINIADIVYIVDYMFNGGPAPHCGW